MLAISVSIPNG